jgi:hypothetical protein
LFSTSPVKQYKLGVAEIIIEFIADEYMMLKIPDTHLRFLVKEGKPDLSIRVHYGDLPALHFEEKLFDCTEAGGLWTLYRSRETYGITCTSPAIGPLPYAITIIDADFAHGDLYRRPTLNSHSPDNSPDLGNDGLPSINPVSYPMDELLIVNLLARGRGVNLHGCGVDLAGKGILFSGVSGAGKSTIANLWKSRHVKILSDDRLILRKQGGRFWLYGTPWHGDALASLPEKVPLEAIFFIKQARENRAVPLGVAEATTRLMVRCFPTFYLKEGMEYTLGFISEITQKVPCYELQFTPDQGVLDEVINNVEGQRVKVR